MLGRNVRKTLFMSACSLSLFLFCYILPVFAESNPPVQQYFVSPGDTLWLLAQRYGTTADMLVSLNPSAKSGSLYQGQALYIPVIVDKGSMIYKVQKGDTLFLISSRMNRSVKEIQQASGLATDAIVPGQILHIPLARGGYSSYVAKPGDILWRIAANKSTTISQLMAANKLSSSYILAGQILEIPQKAVSEATIYRVKAGDYLEAIAAKFGTIEDAIYQTNHLHTDILMPGQPLFIPKGRVAVSVDGPDGLKKEGKGEFLPWNWARWVYNNGAIATIIDWKTGKKFQVRYLGGSNHADSEPLTAQDTAVMASLYPNGWSWGTRPILLKVGSRTLAASIAGMPHDVETIYDNNFTGHFDVYFYNSTSHNTNEIQTNHQANILQAAGLTAAEANSFVTKLNTGYNYQ
ncbi:LysM peptidoglycan-binding domain-containing protein [Candidatus Formimonas warabiya]|uniref:LysM domain-containing protein n=1 Tax=Formimonas warabiya TaxID=1761012 RepID=A0A3G1KNL7_FORW1|nr:LysM peptidoglycan-binding domain-containing protein [Candidatus Formimonas warabiya]ATW24064.1 hypothetical protein DCMF_04025 [Candidatus Formimonas warabiya]